MDRPVPHTGHLILGRVQAGCFHDSCKLVSQTIRNKGRCLVWDFTCLDTLAASHLNRAVVSSGSVANDAEDRKTAKYLTLAPLYTFMPIAVESLGALGDCATDFFQNLGQRISVDTGEPWSSQFLFQRLSVAIQRGNAACVVGTLPDSLGLADIFYI